MLMRVSLILIPASLCLLALSACQAAKPRPEGVFMGTPVPPPPSATSSASTAQVKPRARSAQTKQSRDKLDVPSNLRR
jgi:hypothetical protein